MSSLILFSNGSFTLSFSFDALAFLSVIFRSVSLFRIAGSKLYIFLEDYGSYKLCKLANLGCELEGVI
jgi:hypothetical protein